MTELTVFARLSFLPETLRSVVGDGSLPPRTLNARPHDLILRKRNPGSDGDLPWDTRAAKKKVRLREPPQNAVVVRLTSNPL